MSQIDFKKPSSSFRECASALLYTTMGATLLGELIGFGYVSQTAVHLGIWSSVVIFPWLAKDQLAQFDKCASTATPHSLYAADSDPRLLNSAQEISRKMGLTEIPTIKIFDEAPPPSPDGLSEKKKPSKDYKKLHGSLANAFAYSGEGIAESCVLTRPLLRILDFNEEQSVVAHEFAHTACDHVKRHEYTRMPCSVAAMSAKFQLAGAYLSTPHGLPLLAADVAGSYYLLKMFSKITKKSVPNAYFLPSFKVARFALGAGIVLAGAKVLGNPQVAAAWFISHLTSFTSKLILAHQSRRNEYAADRIAAKVLKMPGKQIVGLSKITSYSLWQRGATDEEPSLLSRVNAKMFGSHPSLVDRATALRSLKL